MIVKSFDTSGLRKPLVNELSPGFTKLSLLRHQNLLSAVILWRADSTFLVIRSAMFDVTDNDWLEIGYLSFSSEALSLEGGTLKSFDMPDPFHRSVSAAKLVITDKTNDGVEAMSNSGLVLRDLSGQEITIVSSSMPFSVTVLADFIDEDFTPEYALEKYERVAL